MAVLSVILAVFLSTGLAAAHAVAEGDKGYIQEITGVHLIPFMYLGAKHMVTGYDHLATATKDAIRLKLEGFDDNVPKLSPTECQQMNGRRRD